MKLDCFWIFTNFKGVFCVNCVTFPRESPQAGLPSIEVQSQAGGGVLCLSLVSFSV